MMHWLRTATLVALCAFGGSFGTCLCAQDLGGDPLIEINRLTAAGALDVAEDRLVTEFLASGEDAFEHRVGLLGMLADVQAQAGKFADLGDTLWNRAALVSRERGADAPELAPVYAASGEAYLSAKAYDRAIVAFEAVLALDQRFLACDSDALADSFARYAEALSGAGRAEAAEARDLSKDANARCARYSQTRSVSVGAAGENSFANVEVFFGTDRQPSGSLRPNDFFGAKRGSVSYGQITVTVPRSHKPGQVESPSVLRFEWSENPALHVVLADVTQLEEAEFFRSVASSLGQRSSDEIFLFVHGFSTTFSEAGKRTAQIAYDLNFDGVPLFYSWPSRGNAKAYLADAASVQVSARHLTHFLEDVIERAGAKKIHLIAHSMGSRALTEALELVAMRHPEAREVFDQVIFAAPDVDADLFALQVAEIQRLARRVTLYSSSADLALSTSRALHGNAPRAGQGGEMVVNAAYDTVDMTALGNDMLKHGYFAGDASALADILWLFWRNPAPDARCGMVEQTPPAGVYWVYHTEACNEDVLLPAISLARRFGSGALEHLGKLIQDVGAGNEAGDSQTELTTLHTTLAEILADRAPSLD